MRKRDTFKNISVGLLSQVLTMALGFIFPRILLVNYGSDTNGLTGTIAQFFSCLALLEAGIAAAANNALYKPVQVNDRKQISYWLSVSKQYYRRVSLWYLLGVVFLAFGLPVVVKTEVRYFDIVLYVLLEGISNVVAFYFINAWSSFLVVSGKTYITTSISFVVRVLGYLVKVIVASLGLNIVFMQVGYLLTTFVQLAIYSGYMHKNYPWIDYHCADGRGKLPDRNAYIVTEVAWTIFSSTDLIVLSVFISTAMASVYSVYSMVFSALNTFANAIYFSISYKLGLRYYEDIERYKRLHDLYNSVFMGLTTLLMSVTYLLAIPFISLYTAGVTDARYVYKWLPLMFCLVHMLSWTRYVAGNLSGIAGYAKTTAKISLIEAAVNIVGSVLFVFKWGIYGVIFATVIALPVKVVYVNWLAEKKIMQRSCKKTISIFAVNYAVLIITVFLRDTITITVDNYFSFAKWGVVLCAAYFIIIYGLNATVNRDLLLPLKKLVRKFDYEG